MEGPQPALPTTFRNTDMTDEFKTPSQVADEATSAGRDAAEAFRGVAGEALDTAKGVAADARDIASDSVDAAKAFARNAVNETGQKLTSLEARAEQWHAACAQRIAADPVKSLLLAAAGGALLAGVLLAFDRSARDTDPWRHWR